MDSLLAHFRFLDLPNEILLNIIEHEVFHEDLENLALSSKTVFALAKQARTNHLHRKREFSTLIVGDVHLYQSEQEVGDWIVPRKHHPVQALRRLLLESDTTTDYCRVLRIGGVDRYGHMPGNYDNDLSHEAKTITRDLYSQLQAFILSQVFGKINHTDYWIDRLLKDNYELSYAAALTSLHNIEVLELINCSWFVRKKLLVHLSVMKSSHHRLRRVGLFGNHYQCGEPLAVLAKFAEIPSVRMICGLHVFGAYSDRSRWPSDPFCSSIEEMHFECSAIDASLWDKLLQSTDALKTFYYDHDDFLNCIPDFAPRRITFNLCLNAKKTLESLTLVNLSGTGSSCIDENESGFAVSLNDFLVLRHIAIDCSIFIDAEDTNNVFPLVDMLPASLETLELYSPGKDTDLLAMFRGLRDLRKKRLPWLRSISLQSVWDLWDFSQDIRNDCKMLGIRLAFVDGPKRKWPHLSP
ncbi:MAG: hypothetical protein L6R36_007320 [Xanthoria steineri]|nr:MAG: hypothetical protein L6R36_007320 [Xanthoria steineri]